MVLADVTFGQVLLAVLEVFLFAAWLMILFVIIGDLFRDHEMSGWGKAAWTIFLIFVPFLAALIYLIARGDGMRQRALAAQQEQQKQVSHGKPVCTSPPESRTITRARWAFPARPAPPSSTGRGSRTTGGDGGGWPFP